MNLKIIGLTINNLRRIKAIEMEIKESGITEIRGRNQQGKTTILDAVEMLLKGKKFIPADVIRHGEDKAVIKGVLKDGTDIYTVEREIRDGKPPILRLKHNGSPVKQSPETFLSSLVSDITFNPRPFMDKSDLEKQKEMMKIAGLDFTETDDRITHLYEERKLVGREVKAIGNVVIPEKVEKKSVTALIEERTVMLKKHDEHAEVLLKLQGLSAELGETEQRIDELKKELEEKRALAMVLTSRIEKGEGVLKRKSKALEELRSLDDIDGDIANIEKINEQAMAYEQARAKAADRDAKQLKYDQLSEKIEQLREEKVKRLSEAKLPVPGLVLREDGLYHDGIHSSNWSESQSMRISADLHLNLDSDLRAIFIDRGEAYDSVRLSELHDWAKKNNMQAIITIVSDIPDAGDRDDGVYYIEEGERVK